MLFNEIIKQLRQTRGLTTDEVAQNIGVSGSAYRNYERGERSPSFEVLVKIADFYHVSTDYLLGRSTERPDTITQLADEFDMSLLEKKIIEGYTRLPKEARGDLMTFVRQAVEEVQEESRGDITATVKASDLLEDDKAEEDGAV